jgi:hypothetical protein
MKVPFAERDAFPVSPACGAHLPGGSNRPRSARVGGFRASSALVVRPARRGGAIGLRLRLEERRRLLRRGRIVLLRNKRADSLSPQNFGSCHRSL